MLVGTRIGAYEIIAKLGEGGMGEVYRARDTRLDRTVAIKVLTGALAADAESRQRFEQEARAIAALNDPHICTIHDVGRHDDLDYLVLEYLEGETLAERLRRPLSIEDAIAIAIQIGDALDHAHRAGIVHRDLKPGNVMLTRRAGGASGAHDIKLLDFGLAARTATGRPRILDAALTETMAPSQEATQLASAPIASGFSGTLQYMAPEQLQGDAGDHRADIFAFGCVLYEMFAGRKAFDGANAMTVIAAIASGEPPPIASLQSAHPLLDHIVRRCLEKDRERRWQNIGDVTGELRWLATQPVPAPVAATASRRGLTLWHWLAAMVIVLGVLPLAMLAAVRWLRPEQPAELPALRLELTTQPTDDPSVALSRDGTQLAFIANRDRQPMLWIRPLDGSSDSRALPGTTGATFPFWSPDGQSIGFFSDNKLKRIDVASGTALTLAEAANARGATWNADGVILFGPGPRGAIVKVAARGGPVEIVTQPDDKTGPSHHWPQFLPDGRQFLFSSRLGTPETNGVYLGSLGQTPPRRLLAGDSGGRFAAPDRVLTVRQGALQAYKFDPDSGAVEGDSALIAQGFGTASATGVFATSETGVLAYRVDTAQRRQLSWVDRKGTTLGAIGEPQTDFIAAPDLSADERSLLVVTLRSGDNDIWLIELARNLARRITDGPPADAHPMWDPDGRHAVFFSRRFGGGGPARQPIAGGQAQPLFAKGESGVPLSWTADRQYVLLRRQGSNGGLDLVALTTDAASREIVVANSPGDETEGQFSPDGKLVAFVSNESGRAEVLVQSFPDPRSRVQVSTAGGTQVRWSRNSDELFYVAPDGRMMAVPITSSGTTVDVKAPVALFQTHLATGTNVLGIKPQYAVAKDGRFLLNTAVESASAPIVISVNWMKKR